MRLRGNEPLIVVRQEPINPEDFSFADLTKAQRVLEAIIRKPGITIDRLIEERDWCANTLDFANTLLEKGYITVVQFTLSEVLFLQAVVREKKGG